MSALQSVEKEPEFNGKIMKAMERLQEKTSRECFDDVNSFSRDYLEFKTFLNHDIYSCCPTYFKSRTFKVAAEFAIHKVAQGFTRLKRAKNREEFDEISIDILADLLMFLQHTDVKVLRLSQRIHQAVTGRENNELWIKSFVMFINNQLGDGEYADDF